MVIQLTDEQIARVFELCAKITNIRKELPAPPVGFDVALEQATALRVSLEKQNDALLELGALLR